MKYAVISLGGKQFMVEEGDKFEVERQMSPLSLDVLLFSDNEKVMVGKPFVEDVEVKVKIIEDKTGSKIRVGRFKSKSRYRKIKGHKQPLSVVEVESIRLKSEQIGEKKQTEKSVKTEEEKVTKKRTTKKPEDKVKNSAKKSTPVKRGRPKKG